MGSLRLTETLLRPIHGKNQYYVVLILKKPLGGDPTLEVLIARLIPYPLSSDLCAIGLELWITNCSASVIWQIYNHPEYLLISQFVMFSACYNFEVLTVCLHKLTYGIKNSDALCGALIWKSIELKKIWQLDRMQYKKSLSRSNYVTPIRSGLQLH